MFSGYRVRLKVLWGRFRWLSFRLTLWGLGVIAGVSFFVALQAWEGLKTPPLVIENVHLRGQALPLVIEKAEAKPIEWQTATFTAYSAGDGFTPSQTMASGKAVYVGAVACPRAISLGTVIEVKDMGRFTCEDRMAKRLDGLFDIYMDNIGEALSFGRQSLAYRVIN